MARDLRAAQTVTFGCLSSACIHCGSTIADTDFDGDIVCMHCGRVLRTKYTTPTSANIYDAISRLDNKVSRRPIGSEHGAL